MNDFGTNQFQKEEYNFYIEELISSFLLVCGRQSKSYTTIMHIFSTVFLNPFFHAAW